MQTSIQIRFPTSYKWITNNFNLFVFKWNKVALHCSYIKTNNRIIDWNQSQRNRIGWLKWLGVLGIKLTVKYDFQCSVCLWLYLVELPSGYN